MKKAHLSEPSIVKGATFKTRQRKVADEEASLQQALPPKEEPQKLAEGGKVKPPKDMVNCTPRPDTGFGAIHCKAEGGLIEDDTVYDSIVDKVMAKRRHTPEGQVDIASNNEEQPNLYPKRNIAALKENYDQDLMDADQPEDSNEIGDPFTEVGPNEELRSIVDRVRSKMRKQLR